MLENKELKIILNTLEELFKTEQTLANNIFELFQFLKTVKNSSPLFEQILQAYEIISSNPYQGFYKNGHFFCENVWKKKEDLSEKEVKSLIQSFISEWKTDHLNQRHSAFALIRVNYTHTILPIINKELKNRPLPLHPTEEEQKINDILRNFPFMPVQRNARIKLFAEQWKEIFQDKKDSIVNQIHELTDKINSLETMFVYIEKINKRSKKNETQNSFSFTNLKWIRNYIDESFKSLGTNGQKKDEDPLESIKISIEQLFCINQNAQEQILKDSANHPTLIKFFTQKKDSQERKKEIELLFERWIILNLNTKDSNDNLVEKLSFSHDREAEEVLYQSFDRYKTAREVGNAISEIKKSIAPHAQEIDCTSILKTLSQIELKNSPEQSNFFSKLLITLKVFFGFLSSREKNQKVFQNETKNLLHELQSAVALYDFTIVQENQKPLPYSKSAFQGAFTHFIKHPIHPFQFTPQDAEKLEKENDTTTPTIGSNFF